MYFIKVTSHETDTTRHSFGAYTQRIVTRNQDNANPRSPPPWTHRIAGKYCTTLDRRGSVAMLTYDTQPTPGKEIRVALGHAPIHHKPPMPPPPPPPPSRYIIHHPHSSLSPSPGCDKSYMHTLQYSARIPHPSCPGVISSSPGSPASDPPFTCRVPVSFIPHLTRLLSPSSAPLSFSRSRHSLPARHYIIACRHSLT